MLSYYLAANARCDAIARFRRSTGSLEACHLEGSKCAIGRHPHNLPPSCHPGKNQAPRQRLYWR